MLESDIMTSISIFYYPDINVFKDCHGRIIINLYKLVSPSRIYLFKHHKEYMEFVNYEYSLIVKLYYPITKEGEHINEKY
jgi:hypothetical protein